MRRKVKIVSDIFLLLIQELMDLKVMEQETFFSEKSSFANQNYKKYGTTSGNGNFLKRNQQSEILIRHELQKTETLQGIAIQYGCSVGLSLSA